MREALADIRAIAPLLYVGIGIAALLYVMKQIEKLQHGVANTLEPASQAVAEAIVSMRGEPAVFADASKYLTLPNGQRLTWDQVTAAGSSLKSDNTFYWQGVRYLVTGCGSDGVWQTRIY